MTMSPSMPTTSVMLEHLREPSRTRSIWMTTSTALAICSRIALIGKIEAGH